MFNKTLVFIVYALISVSLFGASKIDKQQLNNKVIKYMTYAVKHDSRLHLKLDSIAIKYVKNIHYGWKMYVLKLKATTPSGRTILSPYILFTNGYYATASLQNMQTHQALQNQEYRKLAMQQQSKEQREHAKWAKTFTLPSKYYNKKHLLIGKLSYKNKIVLLSDPLCIACIGTLPPLFKAIKESGKKVAVYYYDFSITQLHPTSKVMAALILYAKEHGVKNVIKRVYAANFDHIYKKYFHTTVYVQRNPQIAVEAFNKVFHTHYTLQDIKPAKYIQRIDDDMKLGKVVRLMGTPTILFDGTSYHARQRIHSYLSH